MPVSRRTTAQGITQRTETVITPPRSRRELAQHKKDLRAFVEQQNRLNTFEGRVGELEQRCQEILAEHRNQRTSQDTYTAPPLGSRAWYARSILLAISAARGAMATVHYHCFLCRHEWMHATVIPRDSFPFLRLVTSD